MTEPPRNAQHTPGPWQVTGELDRIYSGELIRPGKDASTRDNPVAVLCDFNRYDRDDERRQNAHLVAAAPELLTALRDVLSVVEHLHHFALTREETIEMIAPVLRPARDAISKAEGRDG